MRTFVALDLPEQFADEVAALARALARRVEGRFVRRETYHVTLAFLGETDEARAARAMAALGRACGGAGPVPLAPRGLGSFGRARDATLFLDLDGRAGGSCSAGSLAARVREELACDGIACDERAFRAHVTIARRARLTGDLADLPFPLPDLATSVTLYRSYLEQAGARYKPLHTVRLAGPAGTGRDG